MVCWWSSRSRMRLPCSIFRVMRYLTVSLVISFASVFGFFSLGIEHTLPKGKPPQ